MVFALESKNAAARANTRKCSNETKKRYMFRQTHSFIGATTGFLLMTVNCTKKKVTMVPRKIETSQALWSPRV